MNCLYVVIRVASSLLKLFCDSVRMMFNFLFAVLIMFWVCFEKVKCVSYVRPRIFGNLFKGMMVLFSFTWGWREDWCLSVVMRVIEDFSGEAVILFDFSHVSSCWMYDWVSVVAVGMDGFCIVMDISSAYVISFMSGVCGVGRSAVYRLNSRGDRMAPCGTPFLSFTVFERWFLLETWAVRSERKLEIHFL